MSPIRVSVFSVLTVLALAGVSTLGAQVSLDAAVGVGRGFGGPARNGRSHLSISATVATSVHEAPRGRWLVGVSGAGTWSMDDVSCGIRLPDDPNPCRDFPETLAVGALAGWSALSDLGRGLRLLGGPAWVGLNGDTNRLGFLAQMDGAAPIAAHLSFVGGMRALLVPQWLGEHVIGTATVQAGFRVHF